ncbi:MAG: acetyl-CoA carboxylase biotin carboxyl carrier protein [Christensenellales bacterium]
METKELMELLQAVSDIQWTVFEVRRDDFSLRLERTQCAEEKEPQEDAEQPLDEAAMPIEENQKGMKRILSPVVGFFHALQGDQIVTIGKKIKQSQPVCVVEAMKMMNEIVMPEDGEILFMMAEEGQPVEYGQVLYCYR